MRALLFWFLQAQDFYQKLHHDALLLANTDAHDADKEWADIGCGVGLMSTLADKKEYKVSSYDLDAQMISFAKFLHKKRPQLHFEQKDVMEITQSYDIVSATSLLSVVPKKEAVLHKLRSLLKDENSQLILRAPLKTLVILRGKKKR